MRESSNDFEMQMEAQKQHYEGLLNSIRLRIEDKLDQFDPSQARQDLQNLVYNTANDKE